mmetsp:Transcript_43551/g.90870  ORF Transcript_43551/g.90870 Transcript_43551/m.90870 type:complete len:351 (-) Transcript_43551:352-1404(-)
MLHEAYCCICLPQASYMCTKRGLGAGSKPVCSHEGKAAATPVPAAYDVKANRSKGLAEEVETRGEPWRGIPRLVLLPWRYLKGVKVCVQLVGLKAAAPLSLRGVTFGVGGGGALREPQVDALQMALEVHVLQRVRRAVLLEDPAHRHKRLRPLRLHAKVGRAVGEHLVADVPQRALDVEEGDAPHGLEHQQRRLLSRLRMHGRALLRPLGIALARLLTIGSAVLLALALVFALALTVASALALTLSISRGLGVPLALRVGLPLGSSGRPARARLLRRRLSLGISFSVGALVLLQALAVLLVRAVGAKRRRRYAHVRRGRVRARVKLARHRVHAAESLQSLVLVYVSTRPQ